MLPKCFILQSVYIIYKPYTLGPMFQTISRCILIRKTSIHKYIHDLLTFFMIFYMFPRFHDDVSCGSKLQLQNNNALIVTDKYSENRTKFISIT